MKRSGEAANKPHKRYEIIGRLKGDPGLLHAFDRIESREVVLKLATSLDARTLERFKNEFVSLKGLSHKNLITVYDFHESLSLESVESEHLTVSRQDTSYYFTSEFVDGFSLAELMTEAHPVSVECATKWLEDVAEGLAYLHQHGFVHGNLKPENIYVSKVGDAKLASFCPAIPEMENQGHSFTPFYRTPEQILDRALDNRTDIYAFGLVAFRLLCGCQPYDEVTEAGYYVRQMEEPLPSPSTIRSDLPAWFDAFVATCTEKEPGKRFRSMSDVVRELQRQVSGSEQADERYEFVSKLGVGASGEVFLARDREKNRDIVVKTLLAEHGDDETSVERFKQEFSALKVCSHKNIVRAFDFYEDADKHLLKFPRESSDGVPRFFFTMEFGEGAPLKKAIYEGTSSVDVIDRLKQLYQVAEALRYIHGRKLIHRDLKPDNILVTTSGEVKLLDFGIAKFEDTDLGLTSQNEAVGTSYYMSPEQINRKHVDARSDIYAFGILAYEMLTGNRPFDSESRMDLYLKHLAAEIPRATEVNSDIPSWVDSLIATCTEKEREDRFQSMGEILALLREKCPALASDRPEELEEASVWKAIKRRDRRKAMVRARVSGRQAAIMLAMVFGLWVLSVSPVGHWSTALTMRTLFALRGPMPPPPEVQIVAIDDITYQKLSLATNIPVPRKLLATLLRKIHATNPRILMVDGYFDKLNYDYLPSSERYNAEADQALAEAIASGRTTLVRWEKENTALPPEQRTPKNRVVYGSDPLFSEAAFMELPMTGNVMGGVTSYVGLKLYNDEATTDERFPIRRALTAIELENVAIPGRFDLINFYGPPASISRVSMVDVIEGDPDFANKVVLLGFQSLRSASTPGSYDTFATSGSSSPYFGVEIHSTIVSNLLDGTYIRRLPDLVENVLFWCFSGLTFAVLIVLRPQDAAKVFFAVVVVWTTTTLTLFLLYNIYFPDVLLVTAFGLPVLGIGWYFFANAAEADLKRAEKMTNITFRKRSKWNR